MAEPPLDSITLVGLNETAGVLGPGGVMVAVRPTVPENPNKLVTVMVDVAVAPRFMEMVEGLAEMLKSAGTVKGVTQTASLVTDGLVSGTKLSNPDTHADGVPLPTSGCDSVMSAGVLIAPPPPVGKSPVAQLAVTRVKSPFTKLPPTFADAVAT